MDSRVKDISILPPSFIQCIKASQGNANWNPNKRIGKSLIETRITHPTFAPIFFLSSLDKKTQQRKTQRNRSQSQNASSYFFCFITANLWN